jgi:hypothetical protein
MRAKAVKIQKQKKQEKPDWKYYFKDNIAVRRTFEKYISSVWKCDASESATEFDRALSSGELECIIIGITKDVRAYKIKQ